MSGLSTILETLQGTGCSPFFITSAMQSAYFGNKARKHQAELMEANIEFKERMQELKNQYQRQRIDEQASFRRESYELGRQFLIRQTIIQNQSRRKQIEFRDFLNHNYWPLETDVYTVLDMQKDILEHKTIVPLNVIVAKTELTSDRKNIYRYEQFYEELTDSLRPLLGSITIEKKPWKNLVQSRIGEAMNVNFIMSGIPTLIVFPYHMGDTIGIETAYWSFGRGLQSMSHRKLLKIHNISQDAFSVTVLNAVKATIGMTRDAYMLAEYHLPVTYPDIAETEVIDDPALRQALSDHYTEMGKLIATEEFSQLCLPDELTAMRQSLKSNLLKN